MISKRANNLLIFLFFGAFIIGCYYAYLDDEKARNNGVYTIATFFKKGVGKNGWRVDVYLYYNNKQFEYSGLVDWEVFSLNDKSKRFFTKILDTDPQSGYLPVFSVEVPDSIQIAPPEGWSEEWMKAHFPKVVEDVHDTR
jgi:hypothetical protein